MSKTIDQRVVEMQFDNSHFEKNVGKSLDTIEKLQGSLNFEGAGRGLENVGSAIRGINMNGLESAVESVCVRFSALQIAGVTALVNIANMAVNTGIKIANALMIQPITTGFSEYETKMNAIQTVLANTQERTKVVSKDMSKSMSDVADSAEKTASRTATASKGAADSAVRDAQKSHAAIIREFDKRAKAEIEIVNDRYEAEQEALNKSLKAQSKQLSKAHEEQRDMLADAHNEETKLLQDRLDEEMALLVENHDKARDELEKALEDENKQLSKFHKEKLKMYEDEYMAKLKTIDESKYNELKSIDDRIDAIRDLTKVEDEQRERARDNNRLSELQDAVSKADDTEKRIQAQKRLDDFREDMNRKEIKRSRDAQIESLRLSKEAIKDRYDAEKEAVKKDYQNRKELEGEQFNLRLEALKQEGDDKRKALLLSQKDEKMALADSQSLIKGALLERQKLEKEALSDKQELEKEAFDEMKNESIKSLRKTFETERENIQERQKLEREAIAQRQADELAAIKQVHDAKVGSIKDTRDLSNEFETVKVEGSSLEDVNRMLDVMNRYADKTIYNFAEMSRNLGTFTAAGVGLEDSGTAIMGIANLAAMSGSNSQQASTAMYQLSQALSAGSVKLQDWNSVVNAGMGGQVFQNALMETARVHGVAIDQMIAKRGSFRESLQEGWITSDILIETLEKFTMATDDLTDAEKRAHTEKLKSIGYTNEQIDGIFKMANMAQQAATKVKTFTQLKDTLKEAAQSGWTESWEILIGDLNEAKDLYTEISDAIGGLIGRSSDARNELLTGGMASGWKQFLGQGIESTDEFIAVVKDVARENGVAIDNIVEKYGSFENSLKGGWMSTDILTMSIEKFTSKTANLSDEQLKQMGVTRRQVGLLEEMNEKIQNGSLSIDDFVKAMNRPSGRENIIASIRNSFEGISKILKPVRDAFKNIFPPMTGEQLYAITENIRNLTEKFKISDETADKLRRTFQGVFSIIDMGKDVVKVLFNIFADGVGVFTPIVDGLLSVTAAIGDYFTALRGDSSLDKRLGDSLKSIGDIFRLAADGVRIAVDKFEEYFSRFTGIDLNPLRSFSNGVANELKPLNSIADAFQNVFIASKKVFDLMLPYFQNVGDVLKAAFDNIGKAVSNVSFERFIDVINTLLTGGILVGLKELVKSFKNIADNAGDFTEGIVGVLDGVKKSLESYQSSLQSKTIRNLAVSIGILAGALLILSGIEPAKMATAIKGISVIFAELSAVSLFMAKSVGGLEKFSALNMAAVSANMVALATAVLILSAAMKNFKDLDVEQIVQGGLAIAGLSVILVKMSEAVSAHSKGLIGGGIGLIAFAGALVILTNAVKALGEANPDELKKGLVGVAAMMGEIVIFAKLMTPDKVASISGVGLAMVPLAIGISILSSAVKSIGSIPLGNIATGLIGIAGAMGIVVAMSNAPGMSPTKLMGIGIALTIIATGLNIMGIAMNVIGSMSWEGLAKSLIALAGSLTVLAVGANAMVGALPGAAAMVVMSGAIALLVPSLVMLGAMNLASIGKALLVLAGAFIIFGGAATVLAPVIPAMMGVAGAVALLGGGIFALGAGLLALSVAMTAVGAGSAAFTAGLTVVVTSLIALIPLALTTLAKGIIDFVKTLVSGMDVLIQAMVTIGKGLIQVFSEIAPDLLKAIFEFMSLFANTLLEHLPKIVETGIKILLGLLDGIRKNIKDIVAVSLEIMAGFLSGLADGIPKILKSAVDLIAAFLESLGKEVPRVVDAGFKMMIDFINGLAESIRTNTPILVKAIFNLGSAIVEGLVKGLFGGLGTVVDTIISLATNMLNAFKNFFGIHSPSRVMQEQGGYITAGLKGGIERGENGIFSAITRVANVIYDGIKDLPSQAVRVIGDFMAGLWNGINNKIENLRSKASDIGNAMVNGVRGALDSHSPSRVMMGVGKDTVDGLIIGMKNMTNSVAMAGKDLGHNTSNSIQNALSNIDFDVSDINPTITPVVDLSNVEGALSDLFGDSRYIDVSGVSDMVSASVYRGREYNTDNGSGSNNNSNISNVEMTNNFYVRNDSDINKINYQLNNMVDRFKYAKGVMA